MNVVNLECAACGATYDATRPQSLCRKCGKPLLVRYDLSRAGATLTPAALAMRPAGMWRYRDVLPVGDPGNIVTLGEGGTPLIPAARLGAWLGVPNLYIKDESTNPTQSFKARGMSVAISMAKELGIRRVAVPSAGNAAGALSAYAARAGIEALVAVPADTPPANIIECRELGAHVVLVDGLLPACGAEIARRTAAEGWFDLSTFKEPYRVEGKKTLGYELVEQLGGTVPDVIVYPTGGGTGFVGIWKAFEEMERMGWIGAKRPRMIVVQAAGCAPIVRAFEAGARTAAEFPDARTVAPGLRAPKVIADFLLLDIIRASRGTAVAVTDDALMTAVRDVGIREGVFPCPEGAACVPALRSLVATGQVVPTDRVVMFNTAAGIKYVDRLRATVPAPEGLDVQLAAGAYKTPRGLSPTYPRNDTPR